MRIFNDKKTIELDEHELDMTKGKLIPSKLEVGKHEALTEIKINKDGSSTVIKYPTTKIEEDILIYVPYSEQEVIDLQISQLTEKLIPLKQDVEQVELFGFVREDYLEKRKQCAEIINKIRVLMKKEPRTYKEDLWFL